MSVSVQWTALKQEHGQEREKEKEKKHKQEQEHGQELGAEFSNRSRSSPGVPKCPRCPAGRHFGNLGNPGDLRMRLDYSAPKLASERVLEPLPGIGRTTRTQTHNARCKEELALSCFLFLEPCFEPTPAPAGL